MWVFLILLSPESYSDVRKCLALWLSLASRLSLKTDLISFARFGI